MAMHNGAATDPEAEERTMRFFPILRTAVAILAGGAISGLGIAEGQAQDRPAVDVALVLAVDASGSISPAEFQLQKEGIAAAITNEEVLGAISAGREGRIAIAYVEWGGPGNATLGVDWMLVGSKSEAENFAATLLSAERSKQSYNALGDAIALGTELVAQCPCQPKRRVIDISGDNPDNRSLMPAPLARDAAVAAGITVNALAILSDGSLGADGSPWLVENYQANVIGGFAAFVMPAADRADFARALRQKMILEIAGTLPDTQQVAGD